jgi:hypothetical protein
MWYAACMNPIQEDTDVSTNLTLVDGRTVAVNVSFQTALDYIKTANPNDLLMFDPGDGGRKRYIFARAIIEIDRGLSA